MIARLRKIEGKKTQWIHITSPTDLEIQYLRETFSFHPLDLEDCSSVNQRPKIDAYKEYIFLILLFPFYDRRQRKILASEIDFFVGKDYLVTVSDGKNQVVHEFFEDCLQSEVMRESFLSKPPATLLYELLRRLQEGVFPMLDHVSEDIAQLEDQLFAGVERRIVHDILSIKRNIVNFRRVMNAHKSIIKKLISVKKRGVFVLNDEMEVYFDDILDRTKDIWEILENQKETINAIHETNEALISFKLNDIMKILTAISVSMLPATLIASIFGMNTLAMPFVREVYGFWLLLAIMLTVMLSVLVFFRRKGWL